MKYVVSSKQETNGASLVKDLYELNTIHEEEVELSEKNQQMDKMDEYIML